MPCGGQKLLIIAEDANLQEQFFGFEALFCPTVLSMKHGFLLFAADSKLSNVRKKISNKKHVLFFIFSYLDLNFWTSQNQ